ncbi:haloacid dehalogenase-like hydrolase domain-containing protein Sgpp [Salvia hispanica]|uniref:haloacid dehalogenase-like hydrolase domain-containing protein Sgpp n=1 Tax=Salvia hispanica TaxID=49212 RepID=UPI002009D0C6|nr:haloacid dehalogenase-like hydrolase domain-containing protein Sgpp [Salvia hispanica]XP_047976125.1 haloacid dehalogenase-like hydrolase domain-containing protein Sgpp [Salvia hispanica]
MAALQLFSPFLPKLPPSYTSQFAPPTYSFRMSSSSTPRCSSLAPVAPLEAILFDIDGTLADSDPIHYYAFREMLQELGYNGGDPITEEFFITNISGKHNEELCQVLFPDWDLQRARKFFVDKEAMFRRLAAEQTEPVAGLDALCRWVEDKGLRRAAVTNAPRANAEMLISLLGLDEFFELVVIGNECERPKPFPDPYLNALKGLGVSADHAFVFEDSVSGIKAGMAAGMPVVGLALRNPESMLTGAGAAMVIKDYTETKLWTALEEISKKKEELKVT